jgi:hypothetical protein
MELTLIRWRSHDERRTRHPRWWLLLGLQDLIRPLPSANQWQFSFTPYGWMTSVNGNVTAPGKKGIAPRLSFSIL